MLRNFLIFSLCFVATVRASGEFSVLNSPKSLTFKGTEALPSENVDDVLNAALGSAIDADAEWPGLYVNDPFALPKGLLAVLVEGTSHVPVDASAKTYPLEGSAATATISSVSADEEAKGSPTCYIDFENFDEAVASYKSCFGDASVAPVAGTKNLNADLHTADKQLLLALGYVRAASANFPNMVKNSNKVFFRLSLEPIAKAHGEKSEAMAEANKLTAAVISELCNSAKKSSSGDALIVVIAQKASGGSRAKRDVIPGAASTNAYNLAEYYNEDYPVIFNIILWFMVTFGLALLAICYAIGSMDPGRDSIIYRMTSTRMKKDM